MLDGYRPEDIERDSGWDNLDDWNKFSLHSCHTFEKGEVNKNQIVFKNISLSNKPPNNKIIVRWIDTHGNIASREFPANLLEFKDSLVAAEIIPTKLLTSDTAQDARLRATLNGHTDFVSSLAFSPDGEKLVSSSWDKSIILWDLHTHKRIKTGLHENDVTSVTFSPDGQRIASTGADKVIRL